MIQSIVFLSNYFNHHQKFLSDSFAEILGNGYNFIETMPMEEERKTLGWKQSLKNYIVRSYESAESYKKCMELISSADVVIIGSAPEEMISERIKEGKAVFRYSERLTRCKKDVIKYPSRFIKYRLRDHGNKQIYILCASAYTAADYAGYGLYKNKTYKWGYFTEAKHYDVDSLIARKDHEEILWCGRFLTLKHLDDAIHLVKKLRDNGIKCHMNVIGSGEKEPELKKMVSDCGLENDIHFLGTMSPEQVRKHMEHSGVYLFTSDFNEGWGAVLNEAMNSACSVISSHAAGAAPFLIKNDKNGFIYESGNTEELFGRVKYLLMNPSEQTRIGSEAYRTISEEWSPENAAIRFIKIADSILENCESSSPYNDGPCSKAPVMTNRWYKYCRKDRKEN